MGLMGGLQFCLLLQFFDAGFPILSTAGQITNRYTQLPNLLLFLGGACFHRSWLGRSFLILRAAFPLSFITAPRHENPSVAGPDSGVKYNVRNEHRLDSLAFIPRSDQRLSRAEFWPVCSPSAVAAVHVHGLWPNWGSWMNTSGCLLTWLGSWRCREPRCITGSGSAGSSAEATDPGRPLGDLGRCRRIGPDDPLTNVSAGLVR